MPLVERRALYLLCLWTALQVGCNGTSNTTQADAGTGTPDAPEEVCASYAECLARFPEADSDLAKPAAHPTTGQPLGTDSNLQAVKIVKLGIPDVQGEPTWSELGYDLDGVNSTPAWTYHCRTNPEWEKALLQDGNGGRDNAFAKTILPTLSELGSDALGRTNANIARGQFSLVLELRGAGESADVLGLPATLYSVRGQFAANDFVPVDDFSQYVWNPTDAFKTGVSFPQSYMNHHIWVSGPPATIPMTLPFGDRGIDIVVHAGVISALFDETNLSSSGGILAGALRPEELREQAGDIFVAIGRGTCDLSSSEGAVDGILSRRDLYLDESDHIILDPKKDCNAISFAVGFSTVLSKMKDTLDLTAPQHCPVQ